jgi:hypothetical protein
MKPVLKQVSIKIRNRIYDKLSSDIDRLEKKDYKRWSQYRQIKYHSTTTWATIFSRVNMCLDPIRLTKLEQTNGMRW